MEKVKSGVPAEQTNAVLIAASVFLSSTLFFFAPLVEYAMLRSDLWFDIGHFWWIILLCTLAAFGVLFGIGRLFRGKGRLIYCSLLFGLGAAIFLQGNFLTIDVGQLNGDVKEWSLYSGQMTINLIIFAVVSLAPVVICIFFENVMLKLTKFASYMLIGVQALLFAAMLITPMPALKLALSDKGLFTLSKNENVILFTMDMLDTTYVDYAIKEEPQLIKDFDGFTFYTNDSGKYSSTYYNFPVILNGNIDLNSGNTYENEKSLKYFQYLKDNGYSIEAYGASSLMSDDFIETLDNNVPYPRLAINDIPSFTEYLYRLSWFRFMPDVLKPDLWFYPGLEFNRLISTDNEINPYLAANDKFYNKLVEDDITLKETGNSFKSYYIFGNHYPYNTDAQCRFVQQEVLNYETTKGMMLMIRELSTRLKAAGIYDNTTIVITGDHGWTGANSITAPALLIKPKGSTGDLVFSDTPVDHSVIVPTILESAGLDSSEFGSTASEGLTGRVFYKSGLKISEGDVGNLIEYSVPDDSNDQKFYEPTGYKYDTEGNYVSIYSYNDYALGQRLNLSGANSEYFDLGFANGFTYGAQSQLTMKIAETKDLNVGIRLSSHSGDTQRIIAECGGQTVFEGEVKDVTTINFTIPASCIEDGKLLLKLRYPDAVSPRQLDSNNDDATLYSFDFYELIIS